MTRDYFEATEIAAFEPAEKIGLVATLNPEGQIHMTMITSLMAIGSKKMTIGQFCMGRSKWFMQQHPDLSFLLMTLDRNIWRGKARWCQKRTEGPEFEKYNDMPTFRYNAYFGINTVHYLDLIEIGPKEPLPMPKIVVSSILTKVAKGGAKTHHQDRILKPFAEDLFNQLGSLTFIAHLGEDGFPVIIPVIQCQASDSRRLCFSALAYGDELRRLKKDSPVAVFCLNLKMQSVLVRGTFTGFSSSRLVNIGNVDIEWVYNSMPPNHDQIYPPVELKPVVDF